jgi:retinol dehydrogenase 12
MADSSGAPSSSLVGKTFVVTGCNTGIGKATVLNLASRGARLILANRSEEKTQPLLAALRRDPHVEARFVALDLANLSSVREAAARICEWPDPIHVLLNNAGLAGAKGLTHDGFELTVGTNHIGVFLFTELLRAKLREQPGARIVNVASRAHYGVRSLGVDTWRTTTAGPTGFASYKRSKMLNVLHARALAKREPTMFVASLHPGVVASDVWRNVPQPLRWLMTRGMITNEEGALTSLHCAAAQSVNGTSGDYFDKCRVVAADRFITDENAEAAWTATQQTIDDGSKARAPQ